MEAKSFKSFRNAYIAIYGGDSMLTWGLKTTLRWLMQVAPLSALEHEFVMKEDLIYYQDFDTEEDRALAFEKEYEMPVLSMWTTWFHFNGFGSYSRPDWETLLEFMEFYENLIHECRESICDEKVLAILALTEQQLQQQLTDTTIDRYKSVKE